MTSICFHKCKNNIIPFETFSYIGNFISEFMSILVYVKPIHSKIILNTAFMQIDIQCEGLTLSFSPLGLLALMNNSPTNNILCCTAQILR